MANARERTVIRNRNRNGRWIFYGVLVLVFAGLTTFGIVYYQKYNQLNNLSPSEFEQRENDRVIGRIASLYTLPKDEKPEIAVVKDKEALRQNPFFEQAENNDYVVVFREAKVALLYRPSENRLVKVGPLNLQNTTRIGVVGTETERAAVGQKLTENQLTSVDKGNTKGSYHGITVVDLTGEKAEEAKKLAEVVGGQVASLPDGEDKPTEVDLLIIAGPSGT